MLYGYDPYNTVDAPMLSHFIVRHYHGPLGPLAYRSQRYWDFAPGVLCAASLAARQAQCDYNHTLAQRLPALLRRQAN